MRDELEQERTEKTENLCCLRLLRCLNPSILVAASGSGLAIDGRRQFEVDDV
jgi:hypothetical protein